MQKTSSGRLIFARFALIAVAVFSFVAGQQRAHAWAGYTDAPTTYAGITLSQANPAAGTFSSVTPTTPLSTIVTNINSSTKPAIIVFQSGTYAIGNISITRKNVTLRAADGATVWFEGAVAVPASEWIKDTAAGVWYTDTTPTGTQVNAGSVFEWEPLASPENVANVVKGGTNPLADDGEMAFLGDVPQVQVTGPTLGANQFYVDRDLDRLYVNSGANAPTNASLARLDKALSIDATGVTLQGLNFRHFIGSAPPLSPTNPDGTNPGSAVDFNLSSGRVDRCGFFWNAHSALELNAKATIERSEFVSNGFKSMGTNANSAKIRGNYIAYNNAEGFNNVWGAAGIKFGTGGFTGDVDIYDNEVCHNRAMGIWFDGFSHDVRVFRNYVHDNVNNEGNPATGIFFEISKNCTAAFNIISGSGAGLYYAASSGRAYNNTFYDNKQHFYLNDETGRADGTLPYDDPATPQTIDGYGDNPNTTPIENELRVSVAVSNNIFMSGGTPAVEASLGGPFQGLGGKDTPSINRFTVLDFNVYRNTPTPVFKWLLVAGGTSISYTNLAAFLAAPASDTGSFESLGGVERSVNAVLPNAASFDFQVPGSDAEVARGGGALPADIRAFMRDNINYPFVPDALTNARCDLALNSANTMGAVQVGAGQYRGAFAPTNAAPINALPVAQTMSEDTPFVLSLATSNLISVSDPDALALPLTVWLRPRNGRITFNTQAGTDPSVLSGVTVEGNVVKKLIGSQSALNMALRNLSFLPLKNFNGAASLQIITNDGGNSGNGGALSDSDILNLTIGAVNDAPMARPDAYRTGGGVTLNVAAAGVLSNDFDVEASALTAVLVQSMPANQGTVALSSNGSFSFVPAAGFSGTTAFSYKARDVGSAESTVTIVSISVTAAAPVLREVTAQVGVLRSGSSISPDGTQMAQTLVLTNNGADIPGPMTLVISGLPSGVTLANQAGLTSAGDGSNPYITVSPNGLAAGTSINVTLQFNNPNNLRLRYTTRAYSGGTP